MGKKTGNPIEVGVSNLGIGTGLSLILAIALSGCGGSNTPDQLVQAASDAESSDDIQLVFKDITLEQGDEKGQLLWKVDAKSATYSEDRQIATVEEPSGELYQDGKLVYRVEAKRGEVHQDGNLILLKEDIKAIAIEDEVVLEGNELEWRPQADVLVVKDTLTGSHPQVEAKADRVNVYSRLRQMELIGNVDAITHTPQLRMTTEHLVWLMKDRKVVGSVPLEVKHYEDEEQKLTEIPETSPSHTALAGGSLVDLENESVTLMNQVTLTAADPALEAKSDSMTWDLKSESVGANQTITLEHLDENLILVGDRGTVDLGNKVAYLTENVRVTGGKNQSDLSAESVTWSFGTEQVEATGNVTYRQINPPLFLQGARAFGQLQDQNITVSSGDRTRVVTEIIP
ncbi:MULTISPECIES: LPS export ABC transporter periplasmic protein LptC [unclassified Roseofilum]|uniref:LPS export ABC transporter periplasmic protein LptC n=1 Tax=unclassified Roseofilum TaxID=2620099 RepID=UPI001B119D44|nr:MULTISPECIES: LPS export ABC transporter periplasmic protein LptC [unclassified Roseofilum]MBP0009274.1 LPS export ABC transporter periplasmic protein LptC [Roseofilum sp. Belize Diploria]MBP0032946.1 LPS export ABC transporter periplasmic protein LptC [Roseofilum sp. Belize BBD 4]